jgi:Fe-S oxidoreductase
VYDALDLCVSCKGCKRECPTGVDMAKMKIEFLHHWRGRHPLGLGEKLIAYLPRYAPWAARFAAVMNLRDRIPGLAAISERTLGFSAKRSLPRWRSDYYRSGSTESPDLSARPVRPRPGAGAEHTAVALLVDTFSRYFEPENVHAAIAVLRRAGYEVHVAAAPDEGRPLCCGRTLLANGLVEEARTEARRTLDALQPYIERGIPVLGLEPSCLFGLRDEFHSLFPGETALASLEALLFEEFLDAQARAGRLRLELKALPERTALLHGHCHQKAFDAMGSVERVLRLIPELEVETVVSSCCGMAGSFGYEASHYEASVKMAEASLLPKVRAARPDTLIVADGTSCRHQIHDGSGRDAIHVARVLQAALA